MTTGHQWSEAEALNGDTWEQGVDPWNNTYWGNHYGQTGYGDPDFELPIDDPPPGLTGDLQGWRYVRPDHDTGILIHAWTFSGNNGMVGVWSRINNSWATVVAPTTPAADFNVRFDATANVTYYVMFGLDGNVFDGLAWDAYFVKTLAELNASAPPFAIGVQLDARIPGETDELTIPPIGVRVRTPAPFDRPALLVPPIKAVVSLLVPEVLTGSLILTAPEKDAVLPTSTPQFIVAMHLDEEDFTAQYTIEVQYADNPAMTNPTVLSAATTATEGGVFLTPTSPVPNTTYWRARLLADGNVRVGWSAVRAFTVVTVGTSASLPVTWVLDPAAERPIHVWHVDPPGPVVGDTVTIYGQGFPVFPTLSFGDLVIPTSGVQQVAALPANADDSTRLIEGDVVTPEHQELQFVAPEYDGPGEALVLEG